MPQVLATDGTFVRHRCESRSGQLDLLGALQARVPLSTASRDKKACLDLNLLQPYMPAIHLACRRRPGVVISGAIIVSGPSAIGLSGRCPSIWPQQLRCRQMTLQGQTLTKAGLQGGLLAMVQLKLLVGGASSAGGRPVPRGLNSTGDPSPFRTASCSLSTVGPVGGLSLRLQVLADHPRAGARSACQGRQAGSRPT